MMPFWSLTEGLSDEASQIHIVIFTSEKILIITKDENI